MPVSLISTAADIFCWFCVSHCLTASFIDMAFHILRSLGQNRQVLTRRQLRVVNLFNQASYFLKGYEVRPRLHGSRPWHTIHFRTLSMQVNSLSSYPHTSLPQQEVWFERGRLSTKQKRNKRPASTAPRQPVLSMVVKDDVTFESHQSSCNIVYWFKFLNAV